VLRRSALIAAVSLALPAMAQEEWPARPIRLVMPFEAGGATDGLVRLYAEALGRVLGRPVVVDNRPGAGGTIGMAQAARSAPDGTTLVFASGSMATAPSLYPNLPYDTLSAFAPLGLFVRAPQILVVHPELPARSVAELVALAREAPGRLNYASGGNGTSSHIAFELFRRAAGIAVEHVPFRGTAAAMNALLGGTVQAMIDTATTALPQLRAGRVRGLAVTPATRTPLAPDLPTLAESGLAGFEYGGWGALLAPSGLPAPIAARLQAAMATLATDEALRRAYADTGSELAFLPAEPFRAMFAAEIARMRGIVQALGLQPA
jgi:tripartite-type tricarboxylate transporter receptor subunit TctC